MGRLRDGVDAIEKSQLRSCDKTIYQMVNIHTTTRLLYLCYAIETTT
jgi:hypothetical protein